MYIFMHVYVALTSLCAIVSLHNTSVTVTEYLLTKIHLTTNNCTIELKYHLQFTVFTSLCANQWIAHSEVKT
jgi:hypothetical protein